MPDTHAILSASGSHRWLACSPSARLELEFENTGSDAAAEGTCAHTLCEHKLKTALGMETEDPRENLDWYNEEMEGYTDDYAAYVMEQVAEVKQTCADPIVLVEQHLDFSSTVCHQNAPGHSPFRRAGTCIRRFHQPWQSAPCV